MENRRKLSAHVFFWNLAYMTIRSRMSLIMGLIRLDRPDLFALEFEKLLYLTLFTF